MPIRPVAGLDEFRAYLLLDHVPGWTFRLQLRVSGVRAVGLAALGGAEASMPPCGPTA